MIARHNGNTIETWLTFLGLGFGYSGTTWFSQWLTARGIPCGHELLAPFRATVVWHDWKDKPQGEIAGVNYWTVLLRDPPKRMKYIHLLRHPVNTINSILSANMAMDQPFLAHKYALLPGDWPDREKNFRTMSKIWELQHRRTIGLLSERNTFTIKVEEVDEYADDLMRFITDGHVYPADKKAKVNRNSHNQRTVYGTWDDMVTEAKELAEELGYRKDDLWTKPMYRTGHQLPEKTTS